MRKDLPNLCRFMPATGVFPHSVGGLRDPSNTMADLREAWDRWVRVGDVRASMAPISVEMTCKPLTSTFVGRPGLEPGTYGLKVRSSTN